ncbi:MULTISPECIES: IS66 family transposase [Sorangium]|uniref:Transposase n=1 Tax=Sorangium cellulosum TaxID=56 RepID=A0A4P2QMH8_SORCE|nr:MULTISPECIES: IS66 family transposase [Sorangium]AUX31279.1 transposase [Sorangium cellulosum]WCQ90663.1 transposase [Sorangium sp. Soce836]
MHDAADKPTRTPEQQRIAQLEAELAAAKSELMGARDALAQLRRAYTRALEQLQLLRRRLFVAKAERAEVSAEQLAFDSMFLEVQRLEKALDAAERTSGDERQHDDPKGLKRRPGGKGRRDLSESDLPVVRIELSCPELDATATRIGVEETSRLGYERGGMRRIVLARVVYKAERSVTDANSSGQGEAALLQVVAKEVPTPTPAVSVSPEDAAAAGEPSASSAALDAPPLEPTGETCTVFITTPLPKELFRRSFLAPSVIAHILTSKYLLGVPFYRLEQQLELQGASLDRGTMCRYAEDVGATLGAIVEAARKEAFETAFCLSTDATGVSIQPGPIQERKDKKPGPCRKGHFFVVLADKDHVFFEYQPKHTSAAVCEMFRGFSRYIQADAHAIYDALFRGTPPRGASADEGRGPPPTEVGCWSHCRTNFWEAAVCKHELGVEGLRRINALFAADRALADLAPAQRKVRRDAAVRPLVDAFFAWVKAEHARPRERGLVSTALGYALNQEQPLRRFLDDGRLRLENNASERALRSIAVARKAWLFFGSDDHASAAANLFSLVASCKLHHLDPEAYLADVIRVMPNWPRERYLELAPRYWARTRARLVAEEMKLPLGPITVPPPLPAEEQRATS